MSRRKNVLSFEDVTPQASPVYVVEDFVASVALFLRDAQIRNLSPLTNEFYRQELDIFRSTLEKQRICTNPDRLRKK
ncbi:hypothetical protein D3C77_562310 [compost metagenome]